MVIKKSKIKEEALEKEKKQTQYFYAVGRRKTAVAKIKLYPEGGSQGVLEINGRKFEDYFPLESFREKIKKPLAMSGEGKKFRAEVRVSGGGIPSQADAVKLGIARALVLFDDTLKKSLKDAGHLTRDSRKVERKKPGLKKARRAPQWAKR